MPEVLFEWVERGQLDPELIARLVAMNGLERVQAMVNGELPESPMFAVFGMRIVAAELGHVVFELEPPTYTRNGMGVVHGGVHATAMDTATGAAIMSKLDSMTGLLTGDMHVRYRRSAQPGDKLRVEATAEHVGRRTATASSVVLDAQGRTIATATVGYQLVERRR